MNPTLSVVIGAHNAVGVIGECLLALRNQSRLGLHEVIVVDCSDDGTDRVVRERFPEVHLLHVDEPLALPRLRARGMSIARGEIVAILDPYSIVTPDWVESVIVAHRSRPNPSIGGTVDLHRSDRQDWWVWAQFINEYGMFMPPMPAGEIEILPGSNISYKRSFLYQCGSLHRDEFWKTFENDRIRAGGQRLWLDPTVQVALNKPISFGDFLRTRFLHGRCYAGRRPIRTGPGERWLRALSAPLLPVVFIWRWSVRYWSKRRARDKLIVTLPLQLVLFGAWSLGELVGYLRGPSCSCEKLYY